MPRADRGGARAAAGAAGGVLSILPPRRLRCACHVTVSCRSSAIHTVLPKLMDGTLERTVPVPETIRRSLIFCAARLTFLREKELHSPFEV